MTTTIRRVAGAAAIGCFIILAATGLWLTKYYGHKTYAQRMHASTAIGFVFFAIVYSVAFVNERLTGRRLSVVGAYALSAAGVLGYFSGLKLPWDALALRAVMLRRFRGAWTAAFSDQIRYVLVDRMPVSQDAYRAALIGHIVAVPLLAAAGWFALRGRLHPVGEGVGEQGGDTAGVYEHDRSV